MLKMCVRECLSRQLVWAMGVDEEGLAERDEDKDDTDDSDKVSTDSDMVTEFDVSGFALWLAGLAPDRAPNKRAKVVKKAYDCTHAATDTVPHTFMVDHAWALLEM